jgi:hypothetical protein
MCYTRISPHKLRLVGSAALLIASKIEDVRPMQPADAVVIAEGDFTAEELKRAEMQLINLIDFDTEFPTPLFFLTIFLNLNGKTMETMLLARYVLELCTTEHEFMEVKASAVAAAALMMTRTLMGIEPWTEELAAYTQYGFENLCGYCKVVHRMMKNPEREESRFMRRKYGSDAFCGVGTVAVPDELPVPFPFYE